MKNKIILSDNLTALKLIPDESVDLIYIDPPFNTGIKQKRTFTKTIKSEDGNRIGYKDQKYKTINVSSNEFEDKFDDFCSFIEPSIKEAYRILKPNGSFYFHLDYREIHYCKVLIDSIFGRQNFINEIIWNYDYGARSKKKWPNKHNNILFYAKDASNYIFNYDQMDRIPYLAPGLVGKEKAEKGKTPTSCWWITIVSPTGKEKAGYPTQKPLKLLDRIIKVSSPEGGMVLDFFAGSGTTGVSAYNNGRNFILIDKNPEAIKIIKSRFKDDDYEYGEIK